MKRSDPLLLVLAILALQPVADAQVPPSIADAAAYQVWKAQFIPAGTTLPGHPPVTAAGPRDEDTCTCWIPPDASYTAIDNATQWNAGGWGNGDDGSFGPVVLPFSFNLYGQTFDTVYININGSVSFGAGHYVATFSSIPFPNPGPAMVAPFWADVDLRAEGDGVNLVQYKVTPTALFVNWSNVGYYTQHTDKLNSFQLILSDGTDPAISGGNNTSFCYGNMAWTTGDASLGVEGLGGTPATVGANRGNGTDFIQFGRFDHVGVDYGGPFTPTSGVEWLTDRHFVFSTASEEIPPIFTTTGCDTLVIDVGSSLDYPMMILAGGPGQTVSATASCPTFSNYGTTMGTTASGQATLLLSLAPQGGDVGDHTITLTAQTDGDTPLVSSFTVQVKVMPATGVNGEPGDHGITLAPNPAVGSTMLNWGADQGPVRVELLSLDGKRLLDAAPEKGNLRFPIHLEGLPAGTYLVRTTRTDGARIERLVHHLVQ